MDQIKEILRQAIKYRFWIAVGISAILPMVAYFMGSGPIKAKADEQTKAIEGANSGVKPYASGTIPNRQYAPLVDTKKEELGKDINNSWEKLYQRQAPLLRWPESVEDDIRAWGTKWPENVDASLVRIAIIRYFTEYQDEIKKAYQVFKPFDIMEGTGVVSAPPEEALMKPTKFKLDGQEIPSLGKVWASQERLWIQRALLEVIRDVNGDAENWDKAKIKQINLLDVGTTKSQDQVSMATGIQLVEAPSLDPPGAGGEEAAPADAGGEEMGPMGGMAMGGGQVDTDQVFYVQTESPQFKIMPFQISFLVDQQYIPDVLIGLENSPMAIQVSEFSMARPASRVIKPVKGENMMWGEMSMFGGGMMPGAPGVAGFGGEMMPNMMMSMPGMMPGEMGMGPGMGAAAVRKGVDARDKDRAKARKEAIEKMKKRMATTIHDPYFNIVELTVYGQARFYNAPPPPEAAEPSQAAEEGAEAADPNADPNATEMPKAEDTAAPTPTPNAEADATPKSEGDATTPAPEPKPDTDAASKPEPSPAPDAETTKGNEVPAKEEAETPKEGPAKPDAGETPAKDEPAEAPKAQ